MHIVYDYQIFAKQRYGGISRYFYEVASSISGSEADSVKLIAPFFVNEYIETLGHDTLKGTKIGNYKLTRLGAKLMNASLSYVRKFGISNVDIFHETYFSMLDCAPPSAKRVITVYDMIHERFPSSFSGYDMTHRAKQAALQRADHIICISENTQRDLIALTNVPFEKTSVVHLGYSLMSTSLPLIDPMRELPYLLYIGGRGGYKNFDTFLAAYAQSNLKEKFSLVCFGGGPATSREAALIRSLGITPTKVAFLSGDDSVMASLYTSASAFVYPSLYEGFGIPPLEAMSFGCPVICSNTSSMPEVVGDAAELFNPGSPVALRTALERVLSSADRSRQLIALGYERIKLFSWEKCARETLDVYKQVLES